MNWYFLKESIKLKCSIFYSAGWVAGFSVATWRFWTGHPEEDLSEAKTSLFRARRSLAALMKYIDEHAKFENSAGRKILAEALKALKDARKDKRKYQ